MRGDARAVTELGALDSEDEDNDDENWMPPPSDADPGTKIRKTILLVL